MRTFGLVLTVALLGTNAMAAPKTHTISFGNWQTAKVETGEEHKAVELRVRAIYVDGRLREYTAGQPHEVTEHVFVVGRAYRVNDALPGEKQPHWVWQNGGWMQVDRSSGRITLLRLPDLDPARSWPVWYRDYVAYCGVTADAQIFAVVVQLGNRKPILRKRLQTPAKASDAESSCGPSIWHRQPDRVEFAIGGLRTTFILQSRSLDTVAETEEEESFE